MRAANPATLAVLSELADSIWAQELMDLATVACMPYNKKGEKIMKAWQKQAEGKTPKRQAAMVSEFKAGLDEARKAIDGA